MWLHPKRALIPFWVPGSESQPESPWQVLPGYFVLRMHVQEPFPKKGLGWQCPPCKAQEKWISTQSVDLGRSVRPPRPGGGFLPPTPLRWTLFCTSSRGSFESVKPNRFSGLEGPKPRTAGGVSLRGLLGACLGYFVSGFMVLGFPLVVLR